MPLRIKLVLTLACAFAIGMLLDKLRMPGGMMVGAVIGACALGVLTGQASMPAPAKTAAQIIAGAFIGSGIKREDVHEMRTIVKPALILLPCLLTINVISGLLIHAVSDLDMITCLMCCVPGGISDIPMIAADLGADTSVVVVMQFIRLVMGIGAFPLMIGMVTGGSEEKTEAIKAKAKPKFDPVAVLLTIAVAAVSGLIGKASPMPSGTMGFATIGSIVFAYFYPKAQLPKPIRKCAQLLSGAYVGASIGMDQLKTLLTLGIPVVILIGMYTAGCFVIGWVLFKTDCFTRREGMLAATPAGASDMALISADLGVQNAKLIVLQVLRLIAVVLCFPSILSAIAAFFG